jgi:hypothetical protein
VSDFSTASGGFYEGSVTSADFVRAGLGPSVKMCLTIDTDQLQGSPGVVSTNDGLFHKTSLRSIPQFWQDPLSSFNFGEGRIQNVLYMASGSATDAGTSGDVTVVISFMVGGDVEVRLLRSAPGGASAGPPQIFGVFSLSRMTGSCPF